MAKSLMFREASSLRSLAGRSRERFIASQWEVNDNAKMHKELGIFIIGWWGMFIVNIWDAWGFL